MTEKINVQLKKHEVSAEWELSALVSELYRFHDLYNKRFFNGSLTLPALTIDKTRYDRLGHFRPSRNGHGLLNEISINKMYIGRHLVLILKTLLHEQIHQLENARDGCKGYHDKAFQQMSADLGIPSDRKGVTLDIGDPFIDFTRQHLPENLKDFDLEELRKEFHKPLGKGKGKSTLKKISCGCTIFRVGTSRYGAHCDFCGNAFVEV